VGDDKVLAYVRVRGRFTGEEVELAISQVWVIRDGKGLQVRLYLDHQEAQEAAGLQEEREQ
jgi:ketosteroid isomerase-like protein